MILDPFSYLSELELFGMKLGLDSMRTLMEAMDHPERAFRSYERILASKPDDLRAAAALVPLYEGDEKWARLPALYEVLLSHTKDDAEKTTIPILKIRLRP